MQGRNRGCIVFHNMCAVTMLFPQISEDLRAKRQKLQNEIKALEQSLIVDGALVAGLTDSEHGTGSHMDSSDEDSDEDLDLPQDVETCLQMNLVYQEVLKEKLAELERLVIENRQQQKEIEAQLSCSTSNFPGLPHMKLFLGTFMKPYFKDKLTGLGPPANEETKEKLSHGTRPCDEMKIRRWEEWQKTLLINSVVSDTMRRMLQPKMSKLDYLTAKMSRAKDVEKEELQKQIVRLERDIEEISSMSEDQLYGNRHDDHDWDKIANTDFEGLRQPEDLKSFWQNYLHPSINKSTWKEDEIEKLSEIVELFKSCHWDQIAEALGTNRTAFMCFQTYQRYIAKSFRKREWTKEEDQALRDLVEKMKIGNFIPYTQISYFMEGRDSSQVMYRWTSVLDPSLKKGPWSKEEDWLLRKAVEKYGLKDWWKIRLEVPGRTDNACRDRYLDCLREDVKRGTWSDEEVELLKKLVEKYGAGKWAKIASEIPTRTDSQCLNKWKWMMRSTVVVLTKRVRKRKNESPKPEPLSKRKKVTKTNIKDEEEYEIISTSEDENTKPVYMDSDGEQKRAKTPPPVKDFTEEYIQPDMKEWIPVNWKAKMYPECIVRTILIRLPTEEEIQACGMNSTANGGAESCYTRNNAPVRCTILDNQGNPVKTYMGPEPVFLDQQSLWNEKALILVPVTDVKSYLTWMKRSAIKRKAKIISSISPAETQTNAQETSDEQMSSQTVACKQTSCISKTVSNIRLDYALQMAVMPWIGHVLLPLPFSEKKVCEADIARVRAADVSLTTTQVFVLLLKVLRIDAEGCKKVIEAQKPKPRPLPVLYSSIRTKSVGMLLEAKEKEVAQFPDPKQPRPTSQTAVQPVPPSPQQNKKLQTIPTLMSPQTYVITQPNIDRGVLPPHPVGSGVLHLLQSGTQATSPTVQPVLQLVAPVEPGKSPQLARSPATSISSPSPTKPPTKNTQNPRASRRKCKPTMKAQVLMENVKTKASKKRSAKNKSAHGGDPTVAVLPQTTAWILTSAGLMQFQLVSPSVVGIQNQVMLNSGPQLLLQPPAIVSQEGRVHAEGKSNATDVTLAHVPSSTAVANLEQNVSPSSVSNSPNGSSLPAIAATSTDSVPLVSPNTTNVPTAVQVTPPENQSQSQNLNVVPQVPFQSPVIFRQSASQVVLCNSVTPTISSDSSQTPVANKASPTSAPVKTSQSYTSSDTLSVSRAVIVSSGSSAPAIPPAHPLALISSPVVQMTSPAALGNKDQRTSESASQVGFQQPILVNQNGSLALVSGPHLPTNVHTVPMLNVSKVLPSPAASVNNVPAVYTVSPPSVAGSGISTVATPPANFVRGHLLPTPTNQLCAKRSVRLMPCSSRPLPKTVVQQTSLQANAQPLHQRIRTTPKNPNLNPVLLSFDPNLMFFEHPDQVKNWMKGNGGISLPQLDNKMPYLPPFVSSINTLASLLKAKESFLRRAVKLLPEEEQTNSEEEAKVAAIRNLVSERLKTNPAYSHLKARFLSCFTLPALLATIHPCKESRLPHSGTLGGGEDEDDDDKDEVELIQGENEDQPDVPEDLEANRQQIQKVADTLGADAALMAGLTDSEHCTGKHTDSNNETGDGELDLPQDVETCLQMNLVYQEVLKEKLSNLDHLLKENRQQQKEIEAQLSCPASISPGLPHIRLFLGTFMKPYFKDKLTGLGPPANEETKEKLSHGTRPCDEMKIRRWEEWQKTLLINSVVSDTMRRMLQPKMSKLDYLTARMSKAKDVEKEELKKQIALLERDIEEISSLSEDQLYGNRHDDHDWDKIANTDFEGLRQPEDLRSFWQNFLHPSINKSTWKEDEIEKLSEIVEQFKCCHWDQIAEALGTNRTAFMCFQMYQRYISKSFRKREWTEEEDQALRDLVGRMRIGNFIPYTQMSYFMEGRDCMQIMYRWTSVLDPFIKKGSWSKEEDQLLRKAVDKYGLKDWVKIRLEVPGRTDAACRDRYLNCLRDDVKRGAWSDEEVELLKQLVEKYGVGKWTKIASEIPNRIDSQCLSKWKSVMRTAATKCVKRRKKGSTKPEMKRRKVEEEESETDSTSEDENIKVVYMDSDEDEEEGSILSEDDPDFTEEYTQPDMKEWIPVDWRAKMHPEGTVRTTLVQLPTEEEMPACGINSAGDGDSCYTQDSAPIRCTILDNLGYPVKTYMGTEPQALDKWDLCNEKAMISVPVKDVENLMTWIKGSAVKGRAKIKPSISPVKAQTNAQETSHEGMRSGQTFKFKRTTRICKGVNNNSLDYALLMAVIPWIGNVLLPLPVSERNVCEADVVRTRAADVPLTKAPVFLLFLKVLQVDDEGYMAVSEGQKNKPRPPPAKQGSAKTVAMLLAEKKQRKNNCFNATQLTEPERPSPTPQATKLPIPPSTKQNKKPQTRPALMSPQAFVITQPQTTGWILTSAGLMPVQLPPPGVVRNQNQIVPRSVPQVLLQPPVIINQNRLVQAKGQSVTTDVTRAEVTPLTAITKPKQSITPSSVSNSPSGSSGPAVALSSTAFVPLVPSNTINVPTTVTASAAQVPTPEIQCSQNQNILNIVPQVSFQPPIILSQSASHVVLCNAVTPTIPSNSSLTPFTNTVVAKNFTSANTTKAFSTPSVGQVISVSSASSVGSAPALPPVHPFPLNISSPVVRMPSPAVLGNQGQRMSDSVSQVVCQQPIILNQNGSLAFRLMTPTCQILHPPELQQKDLQANTQPIHTATPTTTSNPSPNPGPSPGSLSFDPNLMFNEHPDQVKNWMKGNSGISLPQLDNKMPYLPPFVSSINTLASLLEAKESFLQGAVKLLPEVERVNSEEEAKVAAIRNLVSERFKTNPTYSLLKARFLSCFTLPALLATIHPCKEFGLPGLTVLGGGEDEEDYSDEDELIVEHGNEDQPAVQLLNTNSSEAPATQFSGISSGGQRNSPTTRGEQDAGQLRKWTMTMAEGPSALEFEEDEECWMRLEDHRMLLIKAIEPSRIIPYLRQCKVLNSEDEEQIYNDPSLVVRRRKVGVLLDILQRTGMKGYVAFLESLELDYPQLYQKITGKEPSRVFSILVDTAGESGLTQFLMNEVTRLQNALQDERRARLEAAARAAEQMDSVRQLQTRECELRKQHERVLRMREDREKLWDEVRHLKDENYRLMHDVTRLSEEKSGALMCTRDLQLEVRQTAHVVHCVHINSALSYGTHLHIGHKVRCLGVESMGLLVMMIERLKHSLMNAESDTKIQRRRTMTLKNAMEQRPSQEMIWELQKQNDLLTAQVQELQNSSQVQMSEPDRLSIQALEDFKKQSQAQHEELLNDIYALRRKLHDTEEQRDKYREKKDELELKCAILKKDSKVYCNRMEEILKQLDEVIKERDKAFAAREEYHQENCKSLQDKDRYRKQIREMREHYDELQVQLFRTQGEVVALQAKVRKQKHLQETVITSEESFYQSSLELKSQTSEEDMRERYDKASGISEDSQSATSGEYNVCISIKDQCPSEVKEEDFQERMFSEKELSATCTYRTRCNFHYRRKRALRTKATVKESVIERTQGILDNTSGSDNSDTDGI
ncbi:hypothetical protein NFI96_024572 [Prochilodus magdalenae]|nr:hypothetical protein NFI96_024572 [Prochilodus magdalenae]